MQPPTRPTLAAITLTLALSTWATPTHAGFTPTLHFDGDPAATGSLHFGLDFDLHGSAPVSAVTITGTFGESRPLPIADGVISFDLGYPSTTTPNDDATYWTGSLSVRGSILGGPSETLFDGILFGMLTHGPGDLFTMHTAAFAGETVAPLRAFYGLPATEYGSFDLSFHADAREDYAIRGDYVSVGVYAVPTPEPASLSMMGIAAGMGGAGVVVRRKMGVKRKIV